MKIAVVTDSGGGLTKTEAEKEGIFFLPLQIIDEETVYLDGLDITCEEIFQMIRNGRMLKTSLPPLGFMHNLFNKLKADGYDHIIAVTLTSGLSGTMQSVKMSAEESGLGITCIECYTTCYIQQYLAKSAKRLVDQGLELDEIVAKLENCVANSNTLIIPDDLQHLKRGGRLTPIAAALGGMLKIKPVLKLNETSEGRIDTYAKVRTMSKAMKSAVDTFVKEGINDDYELVVLHTDAPDAANELKKLYFGNFPGNTNVFGLIGPVISVHTGIGCLGIQYIKKV